MKVLSNNDTSVLYEMQKHMDRARKEMDAARHMFFGITAGTPEESVAYGEDIEKIKEYLTSMSAGLAELTEDLCLIRETIEDDGREVPELVEA